MVIFFATWHPFQTKDQPAGFSSHYLYQSNSANCSQLITELKSNPKWLERLYDPILKTPAEIISTTGFYSKIYECLVNTSEDLSDEGRQILRLTGYYLMFVDGLYADPGGRRLELINLETVEDPAIKKFSQEVQIPVPEGYIFVNLFKSIDAMPEPIQEIFKVRNVAGVTVFSRYIAVLDEEKSTWYERALKSQVLPSTISHELIHAFVNSALGVDAYSEIPTWFHEGVAIYFSNSGENRAVVTPNFTLYITPPEDYQQYELNFRYLEHELGTETFLSKIKQVIETRNIGILLENMPFNTEDELPRFATVWQQQEEQSRIIGGTVVLLIVAYFIFSGQLSTIPSPVKKCQGCGRYFPSWHNSRIREFHPSYRLWKQGTQGPEYPYSILANWACQSCIIRSKENKEIYSSRVKREVSQDSEIASASFERWLANVPVLDQQIQPQLKLNKEKMISLLTQAALRTKYSPIWLDTSSEYEFSDEVFNLQQDLINNPPHSYSKILQPIDLPPPGHNRVLGSVFRTIDDYFVITWQND